MLPSEVHPLRRGRGFIHVEPISLISVYPPADSRRSPPTPPPFHPHRILLYLTFVALPVRSAAARLAPASHGKPGTLDVTAESPFVHGVFLDILGSRWASCLPDLILFPSRFLPVLRDLCLAPDPSLHQLQVEERATSDPHLQGLGYRGDGRALDHRDQDLAFEEEV